MSNQMSRRRQYNPVEWRENFQQLAQQSPTDATDVATTWRQRYEQNLSDFNDMMMTGGQMLLGFGSAYLFGNFDGAWQEEAAMIEEDWRMGGRAEVAAREGKTIPEDAEPWDYGFENPTTWWGVDKMLILTVGGVILSVLGVFKFGKIEPKGKGKKKNAAHKELNPEYKWDLTPWWNALVFGVGSSYLSRVGANAGAKRAERKANNAADEAAEQGQATGT